MDEIREDESLKYSVFLNNLDSTLNVYRDYFSMQYDYTWLDMLEETIPYIDNILHNPKRFIINEEDLVKVELSKKVTVESVIHLTQHTNLIQDIDKDDNVKPSKILNIEHEESLDTYENRFIYTLIQQMTMFFHQRCATTKATSFYEDKNKFTYSAKTKVSNDEITINLSVDSFDRDYKECQKKDNMSYEDRVRKVKLQLDGFTGTELYSTLDKLKVPPVRSPIRHTNVLLHNPNFKKAEELWNYIQTFTPKDMRDADKKDYFDNGSLKMEYDNAILMTYIANKSIQKNKGKNEKAVINEMFGRLIETILETDYTLTEDKLKDMLLKEFSSIKKKNAERRKNIGKILKDRLERELVNIDKDIRLFEEAKNG